MAADSVKMAPDSVIMPTDNVKTSADKPLMSAYIPFMAADFVKMATDNLKMPIDSVKTVFYNATGRVAKTGGLFYRIIKYGIIPANSALIFGWNSLITLHLRRK